MHEPAVSCGGDPVSRQRPNLGQAGVDERQQRIERPAPASRPQRVDAGKPRESEEAARGDGAEAHGAQLAGGGKSGGRQHQGRGDFPVAGADRRAMQLEDDKSKAAVEEGRGVAGQRLERRSGNEGDQE